MFIVHPSYNDHKHIDDFPLPYHQFNSPSSLFSKCLNLIRITTSVPGSRHHFNPIHFTIVIPPVPSSLSPPKMTGLYSIRAFRTLTSPWVSSRIALPSTFDHTSRRNASESYGGGEGDPKGENPSDQGPNPSAELEHPGPPPPDVGQGTGGGPTKSGADGHDTGPRQPSGGSGASDQSNPQPKIHTHGMYLF